MELYGGERPTSVVTLGMNSVSPVGTQPSGTPPVPSGAGSVVQGNFPGLRWVRTGKPAAAIAAGLVEVWSTIRLLTVRGSESKTLLPASFCLYPPFEGTTPLPGPKKSVGLSCAS